MYVSLWLNTLAAVQMFFIDRIFVFFMKLFLKNMGIILSASKPHCHSKLRFKHSQQFLSTLVNSNIFETNNVTVGCY